MHIKNRLSKMKKERGKNGLQFCRCFNNYINGAIAEVYRNVPNPIDFESLPESWCKKCQKPVNVEFIENFNRQLALILPSYSLEEVFDEKVSDEKVSDEKVIIEGLSPAQASARLQIPLSELARHIKSGRLQTSASGEISLDSFNELQELYRRQSN